jgi:hypothetical protein
MPGVEGAEGGDDYAGRYAGLEERASCRTGPLRAERPLRGGCTGLGWTGRIGPPVGRMEEDSTNGSLVPQGIQVRKRLVSERGRDGHARGCERQLPPVREVQRSHASSHSR